MALPRPARPTALIADVRRFLADGGRHRLLFGALAIAMPLLIIALFVRDARDLGPGRTITYVTQWPATRTDAEIVAQQKVDQKLKAKADAEKRAAYQRLQKELGIE